MGLSFILIGIFNILILFGVVSYRKKYVNVLSVFSFTLCMFGEFIGEVQTKYFSINVLYLLALFILLFLFFDKAIFSKLHLILLCAFVAAIVLFVDLNFLSVFTFGLYYMILSVLLLFFYVSPKMLFVAIGLFSIFYFLIDGYFQFLEMGYVVIGISRVVLPVIVCCGISYAYYYSNVVKTAEVYYEKN